MWPFSRKRKDIHSLPAITGDEWQWAVAQGTYEGGLMLMRINSTAKEWVGHPELPIKLGFAIPLNAPEEGGLPSPDENEQLGEVEDVILSEVEKRAKGVQAFVLTTGVMREIVFYIQPGADIKTIHESIQKRVSTHEVQCMAVNDPRWASYTEFGL